MNYRAVRTDLTNIELRLDDRVVATIALARGMRFWPAEGAPLSDAIGSQFQGFPQITVGDVAFRACRRLLSNRFLTNDHEIWLVAPDGSIPIRVVNRARHRAQSIEFSGRSYRLIRHSVFSLKFNLSGEGVEVGFSDCTPFFTMTARRVFELATDRPVDHTLLAFALFIAMAQTFR